MLFARVGFSMFVEDVRVGLLVLPMQPNTTFLVCVLVVVFVFVIVLVFVMCCAFIVVLELFVCLDCVCYSSAC